MHFRVTIQASFSKTTSPRICRLPAAAHTPFFSRDVDTLDARVRPPLPSGYYAQ